MLDIASPARLARRRRPDSFGIACEVAQCQLPGQLLRGLKLGAAQRGTQNYDAVGEAADFVSCACRF